ncbi:hypothetical protein MVES_001772 [Malassezia vespertilionis]|uniref:Derlin n=1 Tax=Malassezia vespertilionis TaxID=2020962 RepID=A0A2N1JDN0_9BASI|nr:hypothetical protein MVES_001772 [Malassezia vespertilionis]
MDLVLPPLTRVLLAGELAVTLPVLAKLVSPYRIMLLWPLVWRKWQVWRVVTAFLYGGEGLAMLFNTVFFIRTSKEIEDQRFFGDSIDYAWGMTIISALIMALNYPLRSLILFHPFLNALTCIWAAYRPEAQVSIMGLATVKAQYIPYVNIGIDLVMGGPALAIQGVTGMVSALIWYTVRRAPYTIPGLQAGRRRNIHLYIARNVTPYLSTPLFLRQLVQRMQNRRTPGPRGGQTLGGSSSIFSGWPFARGQTTGSSSMATNTPKNKPGSSARAGRDEIRAATEARLRNLGAS